MTCAGVIYDSVVRQYYNSCMYLYVLYAPVQVCTVQCDIVRKYLFHFLLLDFLI